MAAASVELDRLPVESNLIYSFRFSFTVICHDGAKAQDVSHTELMYRAVR